MPTLILLTILQVDPSPTKPSGRLFAWRGIEFWKKPPPKATPPAPPAAEMFREGDYVPPKEVLDLLASPTPENARKYLESQREKLRRILAALAAIRRTENELDTASSSQPKTPSFEDSHANR